MTLFVQKKFVDSDRHEFAMTQNARKDVIGIVTFDLVGFTSVLLPTNTLLYYNG